MLEHEESEFDRFSELIRLSYGNGDKRYKKDKKKLAKFLESIEPGVPVSREDVIKAGVCPLALDYVLAGAEVCGHVMQENGAVSYMFSRRGKLFIETQHIRDDRTEVKPLESPPSEGFSYAIVDGSFD